MVFRRPCFDTAGLLFPHQTSYEKHQGGGAAGEGASATTFSCSLAFRTALTPMGGAEAWHIVMTPEPKRQTFRLPTRQTWL